MAYRQIIENYIHPLIIYVLIGTLISYLLCRVLIRLGLFRDAKWRSVVYSIPFIIPFASYFFRQSFFLSQCFVFGDKPDVVSSWVCVGGNVLATILTPLFIASVVFAVTRAGLSIFAARNFAKRYGFVTKSENVRVYSILEMLCEKADMDIPKLVITKSVFARAFTMGYRSPVIVLSEGLINALDDEELETVIAHELGHIYRGDSLSNWIVVFLRDLMFFTPLIFFIYRDYSSEKEKASDDFAIKLTNKPMAFAEALIKVWKMSRGSIMDELVPFPNFVSHAGILDQRVERLVNGDFCLINDRLLGPVAFSVLVIISTVTLYILC